MKEIELEAEKREISRKSAIKALRRNGGIPGVVYGAKAAPIPLVVNALKVQKALQGAPGGQVLISLQMDGKTQPVIVKEIQRHPISRVIQHIDFQRVSLKDKIELAVAVHVKGEAPGVKLSGGVLEHLTRDVRVRCLPTDIPSELVVDVSNLQIAQGLKIKDLQVPKGVEVLDDHERLVVNVVAPTELEEVPVAAAETTAAEPEVIKKGKVEEGEAGAASVTPAAGGEKKAAPPAEAKKEEKK